MTVAEQPQHLQALAGANRIRLARVELKRAVRASEVKVAEILLADTPDWLENMPIQELVHATPQMRLKSAARMFNATPTHPLTPVGRLTIRQRGVLAEMAERWAERPGKDNLPDFSGVVGMGV